MAHRRCEDLQPRTAHVRSTLSGRFTASRSLLACNADIPFRPGARCAISAFSAACLQLSFMTADANAISGTDGWPAASPSHLGPANLDATPDCARGTQDRSCELEHRLLHAQDRHQHQEHRSLKTGELGPYGFCEPRPDTRAVRWPATNPRSGPWQAARLCSWSRVWYFNELECTPPSSSSEHPRSSAGLGSIGSRCPNA